MLQMNKQPSVIGFLVVYYKSYWKSALLTFIEIVQRVDPNGHIVVIDNGGIVDESFLIAAGVSLSLISGTNQEGEFGGWNEAIAFSKQNLVLEQVRLWIVANDTFNNHHRFEWLEQFTYSRLLRKISNEYKTPMVAGHVDTAPYDIFFDNRNVNRWVSTYFFAVNKKCFDGMEMNFIHLPPRDVVDIEKTGRSVVSIFDQLNDIERHIVVTIQNMLNLRGNNIYAVDAIALEKKVKAISFELFLSCKFVDIGARVISVESIGYYYLAKRFLRAIEFLRSKRG